MRLIDAHKLEKEFKQIYNCDPMNYQSLDWGTIKNTIRDQPEVDPVKHAHWTNTKRCLDRMACSNCGGMPVIKFNWCPYCGARMDEVTE